MTMRHTPHETTKEKTMNDKGYKDWNEQLLAKAKLQESVHEEPARREEPEQERQARFHR